MNNLKEIRFAVVVSSRGGYVCGEIDDDGLLDDDTVFFASTLHEVVGDVEDRVKRWEIETTELARRQMLDENPDVIDMSHGKFWGMKMPKMLSRKVG